MSIRPTLSVVIPNYNHACFFPLLLESIFEQSFQPTEVIVLDDASTDNSIELLKEFATKQPSLRFVKNERNMGAVYTFNKVFKMATCDYVFCPSADDLIRPGFFEKSMILLAAHPQAALCSSNLVLINEEGDEVAVRYKPVISADSRYFSPQELRQLITRYGPWIDCGSIIARRDCMMQEGYFMEKLGSFSDTMVTHVVALRWGACFIPEVLSCWRRMPTGFSSTSGRDWKALMAKGRLAADLMRSKYQDLFPSAFVARFENRWKYMVGVTSSRRALQQGNDELSEIINAIWPTGGYAKSALRTFVSFTFKCLTIVCWMFFALSYGPWTWWYRARASIVLNLKGHPLLTKLRARN